MESRSNVLAILSVSLLALANPPIGDAQEFSMGTNLSGVSYYGNNMPFRDTFKCSSPWLNADWREAAPGEFQMDSHGWITSLGPGQVARTIIFGGEGVRYPAGRYTVLYEGTGTIEYSSNVQVVESSAGRQVVQVDNAPATQDILGGGVGLYITSIDPADPLRNIQFLLPGDAAPGEIFNPVFLDRISPFRCFRFTCWIQGLDPEAEPRTWAERAVVEDARWSVKGVPLEVICALANRLGVDVWLNVAYGYSDADARACAELANHLLDENLRVYVEYSNEVWNGTFPAAAYARRQGVARNLGADGPPEDGPCEAQIRFYSMRAREVFGVFETVFAPERLVRVLATQNGSTWVSRTALDFGDTRAHTDVLATGGYFGYSLGAPSELARVRDMDVSALMSELESVAVPAAGTDMATDMTIATEYGLPLVVYEGGQHLVGFGGAENDPDLNRVFDSVNRAPGMRDRYAELFQFWAGAGGGLFMNAYDCERYDQNGRWGALEYIDQPRSEAPKYDALMLHIERYSMRQGKEPSVGFGAGGHGRLEDLAADGAALSYVASRTLPWAAYDAVSGETRPSAGNFDNDPADELVVGLGRGGRGYLAVLDDAAHGRRLLQWIRVQWSSYDVANGESWPACGDIDGDGRSEIMVGLGSGSAGRIEVFRGRVPSIAHSAWIRLPWAAYNSARGESHPAMGDMDGNGRADLLVGLGSYPTAGGYLAHFPSTGTDLRFARWVRVGWTAYNGANGETWPACGDMDGDGKAEIVVGLGSHPTNGGWTSIFGDATTRFARRGWYRAGWMGYDGATGELHPALGDVNGDGRADLLTGTGTGSVEHVGLALSDGATFGARFYFHMWPHSRGASNGETWPTLGRVR